MKQNTLFNIVVFAIISALAYPSCKHEPLIDGGPGPIDTTGGPIDTVPIDTPPAGIPCSPDTVYFENEILPLLVSNCTESGCHNAIDHKEGVILDSYSNIISTVENVTSNDWSKNELIEVLVLNEPDKRMPPAPNEKLTILQVERITKWIAQGTLNNRCDEQNGASCDTVNVTYSNFVQPLVQAKCQGCHGPANPSAGINLSTYDGSKSAALSGKFVDAIVRTTNWMPKNGQKLDNCTVSKVKAWISHGTPQ